MTDFLAYILITASVLVSLFVVGVVVVSLRGHHHDAYVPSPQSRATPLGVYAPLREYAARYPTWQPIEEMQTVKVRTKP